MKAWFKLRTHWDSFLNTSNLEWFKHNVSGGYFILQKNDEGYYILSLYLLTKIPEKMNLFVRQLSIRLRNFFYIKIEPIVIENLIFTLISLKSVILT